MTVTITTDAPVGSDAWYFEWSSDVPNASYRIFLDGQLAETTNRNSKQISLSPGEQVQIEILDSVYDSPAPAHPARAALSWYAVEGAASYRIYEYIASAWTLTQTAITAVGQSYLTATTRILEDQTTHRFRIAPVTASGIEGAYKELTIPMVRRPDYPQASMSYSAATGLLTVSAA